MARFANHNPKVRRLQKSALTTSTSAGFVEKFFETKRSRPLRHRAHQTHKCNDCVLIINFQSCLDNRTRFVACRKCIPPICWGKILTLEMGQTFETVWEGRSETFYPFLRRQQTSGVRWASWSNLSRGFAVHGKQYIFYSPWLAGTKIESSKNAKNMVSAHFTHRR